MVFRYEEILNGGGKIKPKLRIEALPQATYEDPSQMVSRAQCVGCPIAGASAR